MIDVEALAHRLDGVSPFALRGCAAQRDDGGVVWFMHPDWAGVVCKIGATQSGRWRVVWLWLDEGGLTTIHNEAAVVVLTLRDATARERQLLASIERA